MPRLRIGLLFTYLSSLLGACLVLFVGLSPHHLRVEVDVSKAISKYALSQQPDKSESDDKPRQECKSD